MFQVNYVASLFLALALVDLLDFRLSISRKKETFQLSTSAPSFWLVLCCDAKDPKILWFAMQNMIAGRLVRREGTLTI